MEPQIVDFIIDQQMLSSFLGTFMVNREHTNVVLGYYASHPPSYERGLLGLQVKSYTWI